MPTLHTRYHYYFIIKPHETFSPTIVVNGHTSQSPCEIYRKFGEIG